MIFLGQYTRIEIRCPITHSYHGMSSLSITSTKKRELVRRANCSVRTVVEIRIDAEFVIRS